MISIVQLNSLLEQFIEKEIALSQTDIAAAVARKSWLLVRIENKINEKLGQPTLHSEPFLGYGSYFAKTKVSDVDEMDFLVVLDSHQGQFHPNGFTSAHTGVGLGKRDPNPLYGSNFLKISGQGVSSRKVLEWLAGIVFEVTKDFGGQPPEIDGPAVKVELKSSGIKFDLVPANFFRKVDSTDTFYCIPAGTSDDWTGTNPKVDIERLEKLTEARTNFRNVIRLIKFMRDSFRISISSYAIHCSVCNFAEYKNWHNSIADDFWNALTHLESQLEQKFIPDGFDSKKNLLAACHNSAEIAQKIRNIKQGFQELLNAKTLNQAGEELSKLLKNKSSANAGLTSSSLLALLNNLHKQNRL